MDFNDRGLFYLAEESYHPQLTVENHEPSTGLAAKEEEFLGGEGAAEQEIRDMYRLGK